VHGVVAEHWAVYSYWNAEERRSQVLSVPLPLNLLSQPHSEISERFQDDLEEIAWQGFDSNRDKLFCVEQWAAYSYPYPDERH